MIKNDLSSALRSSAHLSAEKEQVFKRKIYRATSHLYVVCSMRVDILLHNECHQKFGHNIVQHQFVSRIMPPPAKYN